MASEGEGGGERGRGRPDGPARPVDQGPVESDRQTRAGVVCKNPRYQGDKNALTFFTSGQSASSGSRGAPGAPGASGAPAAARLMSGAFLAPPGGAAGCPLGPISPSAMRFSCAEVKTCQGRRDKALQYREK